ncbi:MAG: PilT/PilU family type 4a pilus ATPase [Spartobacteria bacterium]|nr:PilT/PilU family type 4a pilus ATPase [Spartobacteria bacterium]
MTYDLERWLDELAAREGSDLHLAAGNPPVFRLHGRLERMISEAAVLTPEVIAATIAGAVGEEALDRLRHTGELDAAFERKDGARLRINAYRQQGDFAVAIRLLPNRFFTLEELGLDTNLLRRICATHSGLVLVTGSTSSGKSTTIASLVNEINKTRPCHIHTIEDPIEYRHKSIQAFVTQREVGRDTASFAEALRRSMRQDPDVIVVGEMRDLETMTAALTLAETGHLTFATLHTSDAVQTVSRIISSYPSGRQAQVRVQLASTLQAAMSQKLVPWPGGGGRSLAAEILVATPNVRAMIREEKTHQLRTAMQTGGEHGMQTLNQSLLSLLLKRKIDRAMALEYSEDKTNLIEEMEHQNGRAPKRKGMQ